MATIGRAARRDGPPRAGQSLQAAYSQRYADWISARRRSAALSALWWGPAIAAVSIFVGYSTHFPMFGVLYFVLATAAVVDVLFRKPDTLVRVRARAAAESETGKELRAVEIRGRATVLHDRMLLGAGEPFEIEHLVISPRGAFLIDSKQWHDHDVRMFGAKMFVNHVDQAPMFKRLVDQARALGEMLTEAAARDDEVGIVTVQPVLAVHMEKLPGTPRNMNGVTVVTPEQLAPMLRSPDVRWSAPAVESLAMAANHLLVRKGATSAP